jgi:hypothetical protein
MSDFTLPAYITELTEKMEEFVKREHQTIASAHALLWDYLCRLRYDDQRDDIIKNWKYGVSFTCTENTHINGEIPFGENLTWEQSYVWGLLLYEFH